MRKHFNSFLLGAIALLSHIFSKPMELAEAVFKNFKPAPKIVKQVSVFYQARQAIFSHDAVDKFAKFVRMQRVKQSWLTS